MRLQVHAERFFNLNFPKNINGRGRGREEGRSGGRNVFVQSRIELNEQEYKGTTISYKPEFGVGKLKLKIRNGEMGIERRRSSRSVK